MFNVLIVDDEKLIRKGLISLLPWDKFRMRVIGEANHGKSALAFMEAHSIDFLFVDLTMPVMDGFELMKDVRIRYPDTWIVVLTCHQDFDFVQEALRLGAIDYIVKTQFEQDKVDEIFARITERVAYEISVRGRGTAKPERLSGYAVIDLAGGQHVEKIANAPFLASRTIHEISERIWFALADDAPDTEAGDTDSLLRTGDWALVSITDIPPNRTADVCRQLQRALPPFLFFEGKPGRFRYEVALSELNGPSAGENELERLKEAWIDQEWVCSDGAYERTVRMTLETVPEPEALFLIVDSCIRAWQTVVGAPLENEAPHAEWTSWQRVELALAAVRARLQAEIRKLPYSPAVLTTIAKALACIDGRYEFSFNRDELAAKLLMSSSYFSQCFKDIVGAAYGDYVKEKKIARSAEWLERTNEPVYQIAMRMGFKDEKYFSKLFRSQFGMNPTEYRKKMQQGAPIIP
ncbi:response regulator [Paenibacillus sp. GCM10027626]|uniref:response regulator transcription factor n=1 Tax=Paenibacillus sp. GCM10027626 TaxID=3273411 RepID=UPI00363D641A